MASVYDAKTNIFFIVSGTATMSTGWDWHIAVTMAGSGIGGAVAFLILIGILTGAAITLSQTSTWSTMRETRTLISVYE